jgi:hypothetical protein
MKFWAKRTMLLDISVYFQSCMEWVYHIQHLRTNSVKRMKFLCSKRNFLDFHVVKLYASGCSVISHWIGSTVTSLCVQIVWKRNILCVVQEIFLMCMLQRYSVICHWIYDFQTWLVDMLQELLDFYLCKIKMSQISISLISRKSFFVSRPFDIRSFMFFCEFYATIDLGI